ncbi:MAG: hypothetical protein HGA86_06990 [Anaerolineaceae bacterium]|nr:hypothetical protein [Anaerolineaceae bacterium]
MSEARQDLFLSSPWLNAAGSLGFAPPARWPLELPYGGFITNPVSLHERTPAESRILLPYPGGFLLHTGLPNPGLRRVMRDYGKRWAHSVKPVWVHLLANTPDEIYQMVRRLEGMEGIAAFEVGIPPAADPHAAALLVGAACGELPVVANIACTNTEPHWFEAIQKAGASAITLSTPRGALLNSHGKLVSGRLYGPAMLPLMLQAVCNSKNYGLPIITSGGIYQQKDGEALLSASAWAVQVDSWLWQ